ncbi:hypothetical protein ACH4VM_31205 [Streptomyces sp. NPDC020792]|uniref:hypothetical protein n=1 Tax=Streptomyces sp. NPDC020792 TaxID=3365089 RepID=UPI0037940B56
MRPLPLTGGKDRARRLAEGHRSVGAATGGAVNGRIRDGQVANRPIYVAIAVTAGSSPRYCSRRDRAEVAADFKPVYTAATRTRPSGA